MTFDIRKNPVNVLIDTNVIVSALGFGGKPRQVLLLALQKKVRLFTSPVLQAELHEVVSKKFPLLKYQLQLLERKMKRTIILVDPNESLDVVRDIDDNRVLEAAVQGECNYIITSDVDLLDLKTYKQITIVTPGEFLELFEQSE